MNYFAGFRKLFIEDPETWTHAISRQFTGQARWHRGPQIVCNPITLRDDKGKKHYILGSDTVEVVGWDKEEEPTADHKVNIKLHNPPDPKHPEQSDTAHGRPNRDAGRKFLVPYSVFLYMIQPGTAPVPGGPPAAGGAMPAMPPT